MIKASRDTAGLSVAQPVQLSLKGNAQLAADCGISAGPYTISPMTPT